MFVQKRLKMCEGITEQFQSKISISACIFVRRFKLKYQIIAGVYSCLQKTQYIIVLLKKNSVIIMPTLFCRSGDYQVNKINCLEIAKSTNPTISSSIQSCNRKLLNGF